MDQGREHEAPQEPAPPPDAVPLGRRPVGHRAPAGPVPAPRPPVGAVSRPRGAAVTGMPPGAGGVDSTMPLRVPRPAPSPEQPPPLLPRRRGQAHLEPQLREPGGAGSGTPFGAFEDPGEPAAEAGATEQPAAPVGERAAVFRAATQRSPRRGGPGRRRSG